jgi:hypothetical protein
MSGHLLFMPGRILLLCDVTRSVIPSSMVGTFFQLSGGASQWDECDNVLLIKLTWTSCAYPDRHPQQL